MEDIQDLLSFFVWNDLQSYRGYEKSFVEDVIFILVLMECLTRRLWVL